MKEGTKLFLTANYAFNYDESHYDHLIQFDVLTQFFEHRNNLQGYVDDEEGPRIEEGSEVDILMNRFYDAFDRKNVPNIVKDLLHEFEMYEILAEYISPLDQEALKYKEELLMEKIEE